EFRQRKIAEAVMKPQHEDVLLARGAKAEPESPASRPMARSEPEIRIEAPEMAARVEPMFIDPTPTEPCDDMLQASAAD
ncbi:hypothetical protein SB761_36075, partial [Pseudomonas sp. SIMBA_064]